MKSKISQFIPALLSLLVVGFSYFSQWCSGTNGACSRTLFERIIPTVTYPASFLALFLSPLVIVLIFIPLKIFISWLKFAAWALPLAIIFIAITPVSYSGLGMDLFSFYRDDAARLAGAVFSAVSLIIVIWKWLSSRYIKSRP